MRKSLVAKIVGVAMIVLGAVLGGGVLTVLGTEAAGEAAYAVKCDGLDVPEDLASTAGCDNDDTIEEPVKKVVKILLYVVGIVTVVMIIVSGLKMSLSAGNPSAVTKAKQTLIYSVVGLIIAMLAYAIVMFVVDKV